MFYTIRILTMSIVFLSLAAPVSGMGENVQIMEEIWEQLPLRSHAQKEAGLMGGEGMQMIFGIAYAPSNPSTIYLVSDSSRVWKSIDDGNYWQMKHNGFLSYGGIDISVDPVNEDIVFVAGSLHRSSRSSPDDGIYRTTDGGEKWTLLKSTPFFRGKEGKHFVFDHRSSDNLRTKVVYAGTHQDGLLISKDGGDSWKVLGFAGERILDMEIDPTNLSHLYILTNKGFYKVVLKEYAIAQVERLAKDLGGDFKTFELNPKDPLIIYMAMGQNGIYKSTDGGKEFIKLENGLTPNLDYTQLALSRANPDYLYVSIERWGGLNPFWSHDGGNSWHQPKTLDKNNNSLVKGRYFSALISPHPFDANIALTSTNGMARIIKTIDGGDKWIYSGNGYTGGARVGGITSLAFYPDSKKMMFFLIDFGLVLTVDGGETFRLLDIPRGIKGTTRVGAVSPNDINLIVTAIGSWNKQRLAVSRNNGRSWKIIPGTDDHYRFIAFHPQKTNIVYAYGFVSKNNGRTWKKVSQKVYGIFRGNGDIVYSIEDVDGYKSVIKRSDNQGETWISPYPYLPFKTRNISEIEIDPLNKDRIYVASFSGLYVYDDKNKKWYKKGEESGLDKDRFGFLSVRNIAVDPRYPEVVYVGKIALKRGHSNGIFRSVNYGKTWKNITYNLGPEFTASSISVSPHNGKVYIGSSHGTWTLPPPYQGLKSDMEP